MIGCVVVGATLLVACYSPDLRDCTVTCRSTGECASGQICGGDHLCAAPEVANTCARILATDGGVTDALDAPPHDGPPIRTVILHLRDDGNGKIAIAGGPTCDAAGPEHGDCMIVVPAGKPVTMRATANDDFEFSEWKGQACVGSDPSCTFAPSLATTDIHARFVNP